MTLTAMRSRHHFAGNRETCLFIVPRESTVTFSTRRFSPPFLNAKVINIITFKLP